MKPTKFVISLVTVLLTAGFAQAQVAGVDMTVFGVTLGEKLSIPECPREKVRKGLGKYVSDVSSVCWRHYNDDGDTYEQKGVDNGVSKWLVLPTREAPSFATTNRFSIYVLDGSFEGINIGTLGYSSQAEVYSMLAAKYGKPHLFTPRVERNGYGSEFEAYTAIWSFDNLTVTAISVAHRLNFGTLQLRTKKGKAWEDRRDEEVRKSMPATRPF